ncbi:MAG: chlorite dismutase family protein [Gammaproteobacteria bacterium]|nr:chlorite dismutase family protein [Gammaproteobacteria bacterium]
MSTRLFAFVGGNTGEWRVLRTHTIVGAPLPEAKRLALVPDSLVSPERAAASWVLRGITSNERYVLRTEKEQLTAKQPGLNRPEALCAALIPIRKNAAWWNLQQDERRRVFEQQSQHTEIGLRYLPAIARRLHHCRDLSESEPFDFLTWFEYEPAHEAAFNKLVAELRASPEWQYVDREIDIRLQRQPASSPPSPRDAAA